MVYISQLRIYKISWKALVTNFTFTSFKLWNHWQFSLLAHGCQISENIKAVLSCYLHLTQYVHLIHIFPSFVFYSKYFCCRGLLDQFSPIHNLKSLLSTLKNCEHHIIVIIEVIFPLFILFLQFLLCVSGFNQLPSIPIFVATSGGTACRIIFEAPLGP